MNLHQSAWRPSVSLILITIAHAGLGHYAMTDKPDSLLPYTDRGLLWMNPTKGALDWPNMLTGLRQKAKCGLARFNY